MISNKSLFTFHETIKKCREAHDYVEKGLSKEKASKAVGVGVATLYRYIRDKKVV